MPSKADIRALKRIAESRDVGAALAAYLSRFKARKSPSAHAASKRQKRAGVRLARASVRAACVARACGRCEVCWTEFAIYEAKIAEMDHFYGRANSESVEDCWMLCRACHRDKTENQPSRWWWDENFKAHCLRHGYPFRSRLLKGAVVAQPPKGPSNG